LRCSAHVSRNLFTEQTRCQIFRPKCHSPAQHLAAIVSRHSYRSDFPNLLVQVQVRSVNQLNTPVGKVHSTLSVVSKSRKKLFSDLDYFMGLFACARHLSCYHDVPALAYSTFVAEGIAGE